MKGVQHRQMQRCPKGHEYLWAPGLGWCPYCDLSHDARIRSLMEPKPRPDPDPCPSTCCPED